MEFLISIGAKISEYAVDPVARQFRHIYHYKRNVDNLKTQIQHLEGAKDRLQHSIDEARRNGEEVEADVEDWLKEVGRIIEKANEFLKDEDSAKPMCSSKLFLNLVSRRRLSKTANSLADTAGAEIQQANTFQKVSYRIPPQSAAIDMIKGGYMAFISRISTFNRIMEALRNPDVKMIGVYGMGGVGKTMLAKEVSRKAVEDDKLFKKAVMVTVSQNPDLNKIQKEIADQLGLKFGGEEDKYVRAKRLRQGLGREEKMLLVLDDIWEKLELYEVGIAFGNDKDDCKILLTSRSQDVVCNDMDAEMNFSIEDLPYGESKDLFDKIVGDQSIKNPDIQTLAIEIVKECGGLPIAIATVASALKKKAYPIWSNALQELRRCVPTNIKGMNKNVYSSIKLSYDFLESDEAKSLLLILSLFPEDVEIAIEDLLRYVLGLQLFQSITNLEEARNKVLALVDNLKASSLLLNVDFRDTVKMHDVIRDVVVFIGSEEHHMYNLRDVVELENSKKLKGATAISLPNFKDDAHQLPERLECPRLVFFLMFIQYFWNIRHFQISNHFFEEMKELRVLNLTYLCLKSLPSSFCFLQNLQTLFLNDCEIKDVSLIGELRNLKVLDISYSKIVELPKQIGQLTRLQILDLNYCSELEVIEHNVISSLIHLEELYMFESFTEWDIEGGNHGRRNASLIELKSLSRLTTLHLHIPDVNIIPKDLFSVKLNRYNILIGQRPENLDEIDMPSPRKLEVELNISRLREFHGLEMLLQKSEVLSLYGPTGVKNVMNELGREGSSGLKHLRIVNNDEMQYIINSMEQKYHSWSGFFVSLESLHLEKLMNLEEICHGQLSTDSFGKLEVLKVIDCERLKNLFPFSIVKVLEEIEVINCKMMSEIVTFGIEDDHLHILTNEVTSKMEFPQLRSLILKSMSNLVCFPFSELETTFMGQKQEELPLFNPMLWPDQPPDTFNMQNLKNLKIYDCNCLKSLLSFAMARSIAQLKRLKLCGCSVMEEVLSINDVGDKERMDKELLSKLKFLVLEDLPNLERFCSKSWVKFESLVGLKISNCPKLEIVDLIRKQPQLKRLTLKGIDALDAIWNYQYQCLLEDDQEYGRIFSSLEALLIDALPDQLMDLWEEQCHSEAGRAFRNSKTLFVYGSFQNLRIMSVSNCHGMENLLTPSTAKSLTQLKAMMIEKCKRMVQIIADYDGSSGETEGEIVFDRLQTLELDNLQNLTSFYSGNCVMRFPNLKDLGVGYCPQMMRFCKGDISTPKLKKLILTTGEEDEDIDISFDDDFIEFGNIYYDNPELYMDWEKINACPMQHIIEGDINAAIRKLWLNNQG